MYLSDLTVIQEKYPTRMAGGLINVNKLRMVANVITAFQNYQASCSFPFMDNIIMRQYLEVDARIVTEEILYSVRNKIHLFLLKKNFFFFFFL